MLPLKKRIFRGAPELGARFIYQGQVNFLGIGHVEEIWDQILLIEYPNPAALLALGEDELVKLAQKHREAGLEGQLLIETSGLNSSEHLSSS